MALKRAYLIVVLAFAWLLGWGILGRSLTSRDDPGSAAIVAYFVALGGLMVGLIVGISEIAIAKGYSPWLGLVLGLSGPLGLLIVELLPDQSGLPRE
jgi:hypothetical protein